MIKKIPYMTMIFIAIFCFATAAFAKMGFEEVPLNSVKQTTTVQGVGLPSSFGPPEHYYTVFKIFPLVPGKRYEATLVYDAGADMGYGLVWQDGDPSSKDFASFVGIGSGTGTRVMKDKEDKYLFTVDSQSTSNVLYFIVRSYKPWNIRFSVTDRLSGVTRDSQDRWGYYYVTDLDFNKNAPFLLKKGGYVSPQTTSGPPAAKIRMIGPLSFRAGQFTGTMKLAQFSQNEGVIWLKIDGSHVEEILNAVFRGNEIKFVRTIDCRFNASRPYAQIYTGQISPDGTLTGSYSNDYESVLVYPWEAGGR
jgi:hypothetical protein